MAARLAESAAKPSVLLLEAGGLNEDAAHLTGTQRYEVAFREGSPLNWGYKTEPQWAGQEVDYSRGKGLGGSTAINFCGWVIGPDEDYDEWARIAGDDAFGWRHVQQVLKKIENFHNDVPKGFEDYIKPKDEGKLRPLPSKTGSMINVIWVEHGIGGAVDVSYQDKWLPTMKDVFKAADQVGFGVNPDVNNGNPIGVGMGMACIYEGVRVTSSSAYLSKPPSNLTIIASAHVAKIILSGKTAQGVETVDGRRFAAKKEVIISGGAINSPQLLKCSGIGPSDELKKHGLEVLHELSEVGNNLRDHCFSLAGIVIKKNHDQSFKQSPSPMGWFQVPAVLASEEFQQLPPDTQRYLRKPHVPSWELAAVCTFWRSFGIELEVNTA